MTRASNETPPESPRPPPIDEEERAFRLAFARMVEWHRVSQTRTLWHAFWPGALVLLPLGSAVIALSLLQRSVVLTVTGLLLTASGPLYAIIRLLRSMRCEL